MSSAPYLRPALLNASLLSTSFSTYPALPARHWVVPAQGVLRWAADARDEFLGHLLENGVEVPTQPALAAAHVAPAAHAAGAQQAPEQPGAQHSEGGSAAMPSQGVAQMTNGASEGAEPAPMDVNAAQQGHPEHSMQLEPQPNGAALGNWQEALPDQEHSAHEAPFEPMYSRAESAEPDQEMGQGFSMEAGRAQSDELDEKPGFQDRPLRPSSGRRPKYVTPVDELDNSDVESAQVGVPPPTET